MDKKEKKIIFTLFEKIKKDLNIKPTPQEGDDNVKSKKHTPIEQLELEFINLIEQNQRLEEKKLMAVADNQNTVKRFQHETMLVKKYGSEKLASEILPAIDMFRTVFNSLEDKPEIKNYLMGFEMVVNQLDQALTNSGISLISTKIGDELDPEVHNVIEQIDAPEIESGKIAIVVSNGYKLYDRVIKHVVVKVAK